MLRIGPVIREAEEIARRVEAELPTHQGLLGTARMTAEAARQAEDLHLRMKRVIGVHRLPAAFLLIATALLSIWCWWHFLHTSTVRVAISESDAVDLVQHLDRRVQFVQLKTSGSRESLKLLADGRADMACVQGGVPIPADLRRIELPDREIVLFLTRTRLSRLSDIRVVLTSSEGQGSHSVAQRFARYWQVESSVRYLHAWKSLAEDPSWQVPPEVDAVLVVKDPLDPRITSILVNLLADGFVMNDVEGGTAAFGMHGLRSIQLGAGFFDPVRPIPADALSTYEVSTYLVAGAEVSPRQVAAARKLVDASANTWEVGGALTTIDEASNLLQGVEAFLGILVYIGVAFVALLGVDILLYRQRFHELNSLISLVSMHQASKDVLDGDSAKKAHDIAYLRCCSDVLGLISVITGYYAQENSSLLYNKLLEIIPQRADSLKLNIQLKILHATVNLPRHSVPPPSVERAAG